MSETVKIYQGVEAYIDGNPTFLGSRTTPVEVTIDGQRYEVVKNVVNQSGDNYNSQTLWETGDGGIADFDVLWFLSDQNVLLQIRTDAATDQYVVIEVKADVPIILRSTEISVNDNATAPIGADGAATTLSSADQIVVKNNNDGSTTTNTAKCHLVLLT